MLRSKKTIICLLVVCCLILTTALLAACDPTATTFKVTFDLGEYSGGTAPAAVSVEENAQIELPSVTWAGHILTGWKENGTGETIPAGTQVTITKDVTYVAQWEEDKTPDASFSFPDGTTGKDVFDMLVSGALTSYSCTEYSGDGTTRYSCICVTDSAILFGTRTTAGSAENITFAQLAIADNDGYCYIITFENNEISCRKSREEHSEIFPSMLLQFVGVEDDDKISGTSITVEGDDGYRAVLENFNAIAIQIPSQYADYKTQFKERFSVTFDLGDEYEGTDSDSTQYVMDGEKVALPSLSWEGYTLLGWKENGTGETIPAGTQVTITKDVTYVAQWEANAPKSVVPDGTTFAQLLQMIENGTVQNYTWTMKFMNSLEIYKVSESATCITECLANDPSDPVSIMYFAYDGDYAYCAEFTKAGSRDEEDILSFIKAKGDPYGAGSFFKELVEAQIGENDSVVCKDGQFVCHIVEEGGYDGNASENVEYDIIFSDFNVTDTSAPEIFKDYKTLAKEQFTVTLDGGEGYTGNTPYPGPILDGEKYTLPSLYWEGYTLLGWKENGTGETIPAGTQVTVTEDVTYVAQWEEKYNGYIFEKGATLEDLLERIEDGTIANCTIIETDYSDESDDTYSMQAIYILSADYYYVRVTELNDDGEYETGIELFAYDKTENYVYEICIMGSEPDIINYTKVAFDQWGNFEIGTPYFAEFIFSFCKEKPENFACNEDGRSFRFEVAGEESGYYVYEIYDLNCTDTSIPSQFEDYKTLAIEKFAVTLDYGEGYPGYESYHELVLDGKKYTLPSLYWEGHTLLGWKKNGEGELILAETQVTITENVTYVAQWELTYKGYIFEKGATLAQLLELIENDTIVNLSVTELNYDAGAGKYSRVEYIFSNNYYYAYDAYEEGYRYFIYSAEPDGYIYMISNDQDDNESFSYTKMRGTSLKELGMGLVDIISDLVSGEDVDPTQIIYDEASKTFTIESTGDNAIKYIFFDFNISDTTVPEKFKDYKSLAKEQFTVTLDGGEGYTGYTPYPENIMDGDQFELPSLYWGGHTLLGWKANGTGETIPAGTKVTVTADVTYVAQWEEYEPPFLSDINDGKEGLSFEEGTTMQDILAKIKNGEITGLTLSAEFGPFTLYFLITNDAFALLTLTEGKFYSAEAHYFDEDGYMYSICNSGSSIKYTKRLDPLTLCKSEVTSLFGETLLIPTVHPQEKKFCEDCFAALEMLEVTNIDISGSQITASFDIGLQIGDDSDVYLKLYKFNATTVSVPEQYKNYKSLAQEIFVYTITFDIGEYSGDDIPEDTQVCSDSNFELPRIYWEGHILQWQDENGELYDAGYRFYPTGDMHFTAVWRDAELYTLTFDAGEYQGDDFPQTMHVYEGDDFYLPNIYWEGHILQWQDENGELYYEGAPYRSRSDMHFTAVWTELEQYTITFDVGEYQGEDIPQTMHVYEGEYFYLPNIYWEGHILQWKDEIGDLYDMGSWYYPTSSMQFTAVWREAELYTVTFDVGEYQGEDIPQTMHVYEGENFYLPNIYWEGHTLQWQDENGMVSNWGDWYYLTGDMHFTAVWTALEQYTITFDVGEYPGEDIPQTIIVKEGENFKLPSLVWDELILQWQDDNGYLYSDNVWLYPTSDMHFTAVWREAEIYTITFDVGEYPGDDIPEDMKVREGDYFYLPIIEWEGYALQWQDDIGRLYNAGDVYFYPGNIHFIAVWVPLQSYTIILDMGECPDLENSEMRYYENQYFELPYARWDGHILRGWAPNGDETELVFPQ